MSINMMLRERFGLRVVVADESAQLNLWMSGG